MRLPQSIIHPLSVRTVHFLTIGLAISLFGLLPLSAAASPQLASNANGVRFGGVIVGQTETLLVTLTNSGVATMTIDSMKGTNSDFTTSELSLPMSLAPGQSFNLSISFTPAKQGWTSGTILFSSTTYPAFSLLVEGSGVNSEALAASPSAASFGNVTVGSSATIPVTLKNDRSWAVPVSAITTTGGQFVVSGPSLPLTLAAGQSVTFNVTFTPQSAGTVGGTLFVTSPALIVPLSGTGITSGQLVVAPAPLNFGSVTIGKTGTEPITISAVGASVTVSSASSSSSQFSLNGVSLPLTIPAGQSESFNVVFTPQSSGAVSGSLMFGSNASASQTTESMSGVGTMPVYSVNLYWNSSTDVVGYNVYRSTAANGSYAKINSALQPSTTYTDSSVVSGQTYYYAATSVNSAGQESGRSTPPVQAAIP
jgi:ASPM-SPD-2-Hydin domain-containing protein